MPKQLPHSQTALSKNTEKTLRSNQSGKKGNKKPVTVIEITADLSSETREARAREQCL